MNKDKDTNLEQLFSVDEMNKLKSTNSGYLFSFEEIEKARRELELERGGEDDNVEFSDNTLITYLKSKEDVIKKELIRKSCTDEFMNQSVETFDTRLEIKAYRNSERDYLWYSVTAKDVFHVEIEKHPFMLLEVDDDEEIESAEDVVCYNEVALVLLDYISMDNEKLKLISKEQDPDKYRAKLILSLVLLSADI